MLDPEFEQLIVKELGDGRRPEDLVARVCERTGLKWDAAKEEILRAQSRHQDVISKRRRRVMLALWLPVFIASGGIVIAHVVFFLMDPAEYLRRVMAHPVDLLLFEATPILIFGGGVTALFRRKGERGD